MGYRALLHLFLQLTDYLWIEKKNIENHEHSFITWVKKHKKGILIAGGAIATIGSGYVAYRNWDSIHTLLSIKVKHSAFANTYGIFRRVGMLQLRKLLWHQNTALH